MNGIEKRLDAVEQIIQDPDFRHGGKSGSRAGYYVFDYPEETEMVVRERIACMVQRNNKGVDGYELVVFDLYDILIDLLEREGLLEQCFKFEKTKGMERILKAIGNLLLINEEESLTIRYIQEHTPKEAVVFLTGVGKCCRILRSYKILCNLHQAVGRVPVILFYPGEYEGAQGDPAQSVPACGIKGGPAVLTELWPERQRDHQGHAHLKRKGIAQQDDG